MKRILTYICALFMGVVMFTGCSLVELNLNAFYNEVAVNIETSSGDSINFTNLQFLEAYNNYGYQLLENDQNLTAEEAFNQTAELMVERYVLVQEIKRVMGELSQDEKNDLTNQVYDYIDSTLLSYESKILVEWDRDAIETPTDETAPTPLRDVKTEYTSSVEKVTVEENGNTVTKLVLAEQEEAELNTTDPGKFVQKITVADVSAEAYKRYTNDLIEAGESIGKDFNAEEALQYEIDRIYNLLEENKYISNYQNYLLDQQTIDTNSVVQSYKDKFIRDYQLYSNNMDAYHAAMAADASAVYYHPNSGNEYVRVSHILLQYTDEQNAQIEELKKQLDSNTIEQSYYDAKFAEITDVKYASNTPVTYNVTDANGDFVELEDGTYKTATTNAAQVLANLQADMAALGTLSSANYDDVVKLFDSYVYLYNDDPGIMNNDFGYVVNLDTSVQDQMVAEFADTSRELSAARKDGGNMSGLVATEFGYHIILNLGTVKNIVNVAPDNIEPINSITWQTLYNKTVSESTTQTLFDVEFDLLNQTEANVTSYLNSLVADLMAKLTINYHDYNYLKILEI